MAVVESAGEPIQVPCRVSDLSGIPIPQSRVMTGTIGLKMVIGPVGGLGGRGREAGKLVGILKAEKIKVTDLLVPESNFKNASDEMKMIQDEGIIVHPIANARTVGRYSFRRTPKTSRKGFANLSSKESQWWR